MKIIVLSISCISAMATTDAVAMLRYVPKSHAETRPRARRFPIQKRRYAIPNSNSIISLERILEEIIDDKNSMSKRLENASKKRQFRYNSPIENATQERLRIQAKLLFAENLYVLRKYEADIESALKYLKADSNQKDKRIAKLEAQLKLSKE